MCATLQTISRCIPPLLLSINLLVLAACSSSDTSSDSTVNESMESSDPGDADQGTDPAQGENPDQGDIQDTPNDSTDDNQEPQLDQPAPADEPSTIALLLTEIRLAAALPVHASNSLLAAGMPIDQTLLDCMQGFDAAAGSWLTMLNCEDPIFPNDNLLAIQSVMFADTAACQSALAQGITDGCELLNAEVEFGVEWINTAGRPSPIPGTRILYDAAVEGVVELRHFIDATGTFQCRIDIATQSIIGNESVGNCNAEVERTLNRLRELRATDT